MAAVSEGSQGIVHGSDEAASLKGHDHMLQPREFLERDPLA